ncbi:MAG: hypothetical protein LBC20_05640 [Planctomycetaceae bacterium]|nr:hypothetical protein [Planctomycetaceae bacterium]
MEKQPHQLTITKNQLTIGKNRLAIDKKRLAAGKNRLAENKNQCNISVEFSKTYFNCFRKPHFQPNCS